MTPVISGVVAILALPFDEESRLLAGELRTLVDWLVDGGVDGVGIAVASELYALDDAEWSDVVAITVGAADGRVPVLASVGQETADAAAGRTRRAIELGAAAVLAHPPRNRQMAVDELVEFYEALVASGAEVWVQDAPQLTGVEIPIEGYPRLAAAGVGGFKVEAHPTPDKIRAARVLTGESVHYLGGAGGFAFADELAAGAMGTMPGVTQVPIFVRELAEFRSGGEDAARAVHQEHGDVWRFGAAHGPAFIHLQKLALVDMGLFSTAHCRFSPARVDDAEAVEWCALVRSSLAEQ